MVTIAFLGDLGSGKTTLCTRQTILTKQLHPDKEIYCNYRLTNYSYNILDLMDLYLEHQDTRNIIIVADEFYTMMDSRFSGSHRNMLESYFIAMTRKAKADFFITMQYEKFTDCRLSSFVKVKYIMEKILINKEIILDGKKFMYKIPHPYLFKCHLIDERNENNIIHRDFIFNGLRWFNEFNTDQYILPPDDILNRIKIKKLKDKITLNKLTKQSEDIDNGIIKETKKTKHKSEFKL